MSGLDIFGEVSRRYWLLNEFILGNLRAVSWELVVLTAAVDGRVGRTGVSGH